MVSIKDSLKKLVTATNKTTTPTPDAVKRMQIIAETARKEAKNPKGK